jgi:hypothetical protein
MATNKSSEAPKKPTKKAEEPTQTMEVPKVLHVTVRDGLLLSGELRNTPMHMLYEHIRSSMNCVHNVDMLKELASFHGVAVEVEEKK